MSIRTKVFAVAIASLAAAAMAPVTSAQNFDVEKARMAKASFSHCVEAAKDAPDSALQQVIETCRIGMGDIAAMFSSYPDHTPTDIDILRVYSGATAYIVMTMDMRLNENRLSIDGCAQARHVKYMYDTLTDRTNEDAEDQLRSNAETVTEHIIPWCESAYPQH